MTKKKIFIFIYILFFVAHLLYGSWHVIGPITPRHIMSIAMCLICWKEHGVRTDKYFLIYYLFIFAFILSGIITHYTEETFTWVLSYYFVCYVAYESTKILILKYNGIRYLIYALLSIGFINSLFTIGQMYQMPFATEYGNLFHFNIDNELLSYVDESNRTSMEGFAIPGIVGNVSNGYLMSCMCILSLYSKDAQLHLWNILCWVFFTIVLVMVQERTALISASFLSLFVLLKNIFDNRSNKMSLKKIFIFIVLLLIGLYAVPFVIKQMMTGNSRYAELGFNYAEERGGLASGAWNYFLQNPLGGNFDFLASYEAPHNLFMNALLFGGVLGFVAIVWLLAIQFVLLIKVFLAKLNVRNYCLFIFCTIFLCFNLVSLTHNASVVTGDAIFWTYWACCISLITRCPKKQKLARNKQLL